ncbi:MAG TPA: carboxypeptidase regulatory-like domain-containing protein, partial [Longimicrobium sp.]|nr:carboxypeptidase regulatory-like domain-containing protein [Longimicrobium sp.]
MRVLPLLALLVLAAAPAGAQTVRGRVLDAASGKPVAQALVTATDSAGTTVRARADDEGAFSLALPGGGQARIVAERLGYEAASVAVAAG